MISNIRTFIISYIIFSIIILYFFFYFLNKKDIPLNYDKKNVLVSVDGNPISLSDYILQKNKLEPYLDSDSENSKEYILNTLTDNMILLLEAERLKLNQQESFLKEIEYFWHQSLVGELLKKKANEIKSKISVDEEDILSYYNALKKEYFFRYLEFIPSIKIEDLSNIKNYDDYINNNKNIIDYDSNFIWVNIQNIESEFKDLILFKNFELNKWKIFSTNDKFFLVKISKSKNNELKSFKEMKKELKKFIIEEKEQKFMNVWMNNLRKRTIISLNKGLYKKV